MTLDELAVKHNTDKGNQGHNYCRIYEMYLADKKYKIKKVLEIGVDRGQSLLMWRDYFPNAEIYGIDIIDVPLKEERITVFKGDGTDQGFADRVIKPLGEFDLIIDDGSHTSRDINTTLEIYFHNYLKPGGFYVIEDLHAVYKRCNNENIIKNSMDYLFELVHEINWGGKIAGDCWSDFNKCGEPANLWQKNLFCIYFYKSLAFLGKRQ